MLGLNGILDTCYEACCSWNHEEVPKQGEDLGECQPSFPSSPSKLSSIGSWDNDQFSPPSSPSVIREMKVKLANDDNMSIETTQTAVDVTMETHTTMEASFDNLNLADDDIDMHNGQSQSSPARSILVEDHGEYGRRGTLSPGIARLTSYNNGRKNGSLKFQRKSERIKPTDYDVLLGRGGLTNKHPGNVRFRNLINERKDKYKEILPGQYKAKKQFSTNVMNEVHAYGGRFLQQVKVKPSTPVEWVIAKKTKARKKCSQALRE